MALLPLLLPASEGSPAQVQLWRRQAEVLLLPQYKNGELPSLGWPDAWLRGWAGAAVVAVRAAWSVAGWCEQLLGLASLSVLSCVGLRVKQPPQHTRGRGVAARASQAAVLATRAVGPLVALRVQALG